jgi:hypothetical protein
MLFIMMKGTFVLLIWHYVRKAYIGGEVQVYASLTGSRAGRYTPGARASGNH